jgi:hypothetical protein
MFMRMQQLDVAGKIVGRKAASVLRTVPLNANITVLVLVLVIIPTISGVALIA